MVTKQRESMSANRRLWQMQCCSLRAISASAYGVPTEYLRADALHDNDVGINADSTRERSSSACVPYALTHVSSQLKVQYNIRSDLSEFRDLPHECSRFARLIKSLRMVASHVHPLVCL